MRRVLATILCASMVTTGCATAGPRLTATRFAPAQAGGSSTAAMAEYVQRLPAGSRVRVERVDGSTLRGTLMKAAPDAIVVQKNTRVPEPPVEVPMGQIARVTIENGGSSAAKAVAIGIASGVGAFFAILAIAFAASGD
jgi:hypothetical protein